LNDHFGNSDSTKMIKTAIWLTLKFTRNFSNKNVFRYSRTHIYINI